MRSAALLARTPAPASVLRTVAQAGRPLDAPVRAAMQQQLGHDFGRVRIHTDGAGAESARDVSALAYTVGEDLVFGTGAYRPETAAGRRLIAHELAHVVQQRRLGPRVQRFSAELEGTQVFIKPERGDKETDLKRVACAEVPTKTLKGATRIDVTPCLPRGVAKALTVGPLNCAHFVRSALKGERASTEESVSLVTDELWREVLASGYRITGVWELATSGKVTKSKPPSDDIKLAVPQSEPRMGDLVFMSGYITGFQPKKPHIIDPAGENFTINFDHVGIFIVRDREGRDWHVAKDGDENPLGVYRTGTDVNPEAAKGAYVRGAASLVIYLAAPTPEKAQAAEKAETKPAVTPTPKKKPDR